MTIIGKELPWIEPEELYHYRATSGMPPGGYSQCDYAKTFSDRVELFNLPDARLELLKFQIPGTNFFDLRSPYPLLNCLDYGVMLNEIRSISDAVSLTAVLDPFSIPSTQALKACFDIVRPYKTSYLVDLEHAKLDRMRRNHRNNVRYALSHVVVERAAQNHSHAHEFFDLYSNLCRLHRIHGLAAMTEVELAGQFNISGAHYFRAINQASGDICGALICFQDVNVVHGHLAASSSLGYQQRVQFALYWKAIEFFSNCARWFNLGGVADEGSGKGLDFFKSGWAHARTRSYLCGAVLRPDVYRVLVHTQHDELIEGSQEFFPAYRAKLGWPC